MMKKLFLFSFAFLVSVFFLLIYIGNVTPPNIKEKPLTIEEIKKTSQFFPKKDWQVHNVFLTGNAFERGQQYAYWTQDLLFKQERSLLKKLDEIFPWTPTQYGIAFFSMAWFQGLENYLKANWLEEMYGVSLFGSKERIFFATPFTRQIAYHGIHDMGQMMIDQGFVLGACSQIAIPQDEGWLIGRNFDFEAGRVFDEDKVMKWVFPDKGEAFVSVVFSGMVGVITGINQKGVYVAINAAGSSDFTRVGTPTTLIALDALQNAQSATEAVEIIKKAHSLITEIFVVADKKSMVYIVEKTPERVRVLKKQTAQAITNHLQHPDFKEDEINQRRMKNNTTLVRQEQIWSEIDSIKDEFSMAQALRTKFRLEGEEVLGHRSSVDALIASHSVVYNSKRQRLYVSEGPSLKNRFIGFDLKESFQQKSPVLIDPLPQDPDLMGFNYYQLRGQISDLNEIRDVAQSGDCETAGDLFAEINPTLFANHYSFYWSRAEIELCRKDKARALRYFLKARKLEPAYLHEKEHINENIANLKD